MHRITRRPLFWLASAAVVAGGGILLAPRLRVANLPSETTAEPPGPTAALGPLPVALTDEPPQPARLCGKIETALSELNGAGGESAERFVAEMTIPPCAPPPLGEDPWRPSTRVASYQADIPSSSNLTGGMGVRPAFSQEAGPNTGNKSAPPPGRTKAESSPTPDEATKPAYLKHRIADGDTLSSLAQRYLGSSKRFIDIFAANRDRLESPDLLPIGVELRIPTTPAAVQSVE